MTEIERLARIAETYVRPIMVVGDYPGAPTQQGLGYTGGVEAVRAILQAMREPSEETYQAGWKAFEKLPIIPQNIWQSMIDHILSETP